MWVNGTKGTINLSSGSIPILCSVGTLDIILHHWYVLTNILAKCLPLTMQAFILDLSKASPGVQQWSRVLAYDDQPAQCHDGLFVTHCLGQVGASKIEAYQGVGRQGYS